VCGRYARSKDKAQLVEEFDVRQAPAEELSADYNVAPTKQVYVVADRSGEAQGEAVRTLAIARWGLVPSWAKDRSIGSRLINARVESASSKPAFRSAWRRRRCLVPADGFYEWYEPTGADAVRGKSGKPLKQPFYIHPADGHSLAMAGLYEFWRDPEGEPADPWLMSVTILTTTATDSLGRIHDRMPLPLPPEAWAQWLDPELSGDDAAGALREHRAASLAAYPVARDVNSVRNNGPHLSEPLPAEAP